MKKLLFVWLALPFLMASSPVPPHWIIAPDGAIRLDLRTLPLPFGDHLEMSGEMMSAVYRWQLDGQACFDAERSLVFPMLRTVPNDTHASLTYRVRTDIPSLLSADGYSLGKGRVKSLEINAYARIHTRHALLHPIPWRPASCDSLDLVRTVFPSPDQAFLGEWYEVYNRSDKPVTVCVPSFSQIFETLPDQGTEGSYQIRADLSGSCTKCLSPGDSLSFGVSFYGCKSDAPAVRPDLRGALDARLERVSSWDEALVLESPDTVVDRAFRFAKIRACESIYKTRGGYMHGPGGEAYYAAIWANDQAEYINPFFPFVGYGIGNASARNAFRHFARFINEEYRPIPSSVFAEGIGTWSGAGDRGDAAMIAYGASRYALARGDRSEAEELWPLISWCLEYCRRHLNDAGVVCSDSDELEGRFPAGPANLCTSTLYYDALLSASMLAKELGLPRPTVSDFNLRAKKMADAIDRYFGAQVQGFRTYRYYEGNTLLRSWICMPLIVGLRGREEGTIAALTSESMLTPDGVLTQQGSRTFWDRSTLYTLRAVFLAGEADLGAGLLHDYSVKRLLGDHVPYAVEAWPEGGQRHLSAESALYCRVVTEGMFGLRPTGLHSFTLCPRLPAAWDKMALRHVRAFNADFDIEVRRTTGGLSILVQSADGTLLQRRVREGQTIPVRF